MLDVTCTGCVSIQKLDVLYETAKLISDQTQLETSLEKSLASLSKSLYLDNCVVYIIEDEKLKIYAAHNFNRHQKRLSEYKIGEGATGLAAESKEPIVVENIHNNILFLNKSGHKNPETLSYIAVPMIVENDLVGVVGATLTRKTVMDFEEVVRLLTICSSLYGQAIVSHDMIEQEKERLTDLKLYYKMEWDAKVHNFGDIIGQSPKMKQVFNVIERIAQSSVTVLVRGETGTGKELVAAAIHKRSKRAEEPFVKLNCAAISDTLIESELFGHEKGAFTDAKEMRKGRFELADGGTLFLDEIGDISASAQVKLLRVLQEREFERVGGSKTVKVNVRLIAATNRNLEQMVKDGEFREDLFYRLNVIPIDLPPLRERGDDVRLLVNFFLERSMKNHKKKVTITDSAMDILMRYPWPGNIRELENTIERIVLMSDESGISADDMRLMLPALKSENLLTQCKDVDSQGEKTLDDLEKEAIINALERYDGSSSEAAKSLGISVRQIKYKVEKYGL